jgi:hypothetical protein
MINQLLALKIYPMKFLHLTISSNDLTYLDSNRWKEFLRRDLSQLDQLKFRYDQYIEDGQNFFSKSSRNKSIDILILD